jgi:hypothetical protein
VVVVVGVGMLVPCSTVVVSVALTWRFVGLSYDSDSSTFVAFCVSVVRMSMTSIRSFRAGGVRDGRIPPTTCNVDLIDFVVAVGEDSFVGDQCDVVELWWDA